MGTDALDLLFERLAAQDVLARGLAAHDVEVLEAVELALHVAAAVGVVVGTLEGGGVDVVPACVHRCAGGGERCIGALGDRERVELGAHHDPSSGAADAMQDAGARDGGAGAAEGIGHARCRRVLGVGELGRGMDAPAQRDRGGQLHVDRGEQRARERFSRRRHSDDRPGRGQPDSQGMRPR